MNQINMFFTLSALQRRKEPPDISRFINSNNHADLPEKKSEQSKIPVSPSELFEMSPDYDSFKDALIVLQGNFSFEVEEMIELGELYFERYPDNFNSSSSEEIHLGYRIARICLVERLIKEIPLNRKHYYRKMYYKTSEIDDIAARIIQKYGEVTIFDDFTLITSNLDMLYLKICSMPAGMIKERYTGGISIFFNIAYLIKMSIMRRRSMVI